MLLSLSSLVRPLWSSDVGKLILLPYLVDPKLLKLICLADINPNIFVTGLFILH